MEFTIGNTTKKVKFALPATVNFATYVVETESKTSQARNAVITDHVAECNVPYFAVAKEGVATVKLTFNEDQKYVVNKKIEVVTPYLEKWEVAEILTSANDRDLELAEAAARHVIDIHCNQTFGFESDTVKSLVGNGKYLETPRRLITLKAIGNQEFNMTVNDYVLNFGNSYIEVKQTPPDEFTETVIHYPGILATQTFRKDTAYAIRGDWGYESVPEAIKDSMRMLIGDYACYDSKYRTKYLESLATADTRFQFNSKAWSGTGNADVDLLLEPYVRNEWLVV